MFQVSFVNIYSYQRFLLYEELCLHLILHDFSLSHQCCSEYLSLNDEMAHPCLLQRKGFRCFSTIEKETALFHREMPKTSPGKIRAQNTQRQSRIMSSNASLC